MHLLSKPQVCQVEFHLGLRHTHTHKTIIWRPNTPMPESSDRKGLQADELEKHCGEKRRAPNICVFHVFSFFLTNVYSCQTMSNYTTANSNGP